MSMSKGQVLYYGVSPTQATGFGRVAEELIRNLKDLWDFEVYGIGHHKYDKRPDGLDDIEIDAATDINDAHGRIGLLETLKRMGDQYDILYILQDYFTLNARIQGKGFPQLEDGQEFARHVNAICEEQDIETVLYMPVEERPYPDWIEPLLEFDRIVVYCDWAAEKVEQALGSRPDQLRVIEHGTNPDMFVPADEEDVQEMREEILPNPDDFVVGYVGANQRRKNIGRDVIAGFGELWKEEKDVSLMLKTDRDDTDGWEMDRVLWDERMRSGVPRDKMFLTTQSKNSRVDDASLNTLYNCMDVLYLPSMEGWGLPVTEAFTARTPTIVGDHAALSYIGDGGRSIKVNVPGPENRNFTARWTNDHGAQRTLVDLYDFVEKIQEFRNADEEEIQSMLGRAEQWAQDRPWSKVAQQWDRLFTSLM